MGYFGNFVYYNLCSGGKRLQVGFILITTNAAGTLVVGLTPVSWSAERLGSDDLT